MVFRKSWISLFFFFFLFHNLIHIPHSRSIHFCLKILHYSAGFRIPPSHVLKSTCHAVSHTSLLSKLHSPCSSQMQRWHFDHEPWSLEIQRAGVTCLYHVSGSVPSGFYSRIHMHVVMKPVCYLCTKPPPTPPCASLVTEMGTTEVYYWRAL